MPVLRAVDEQGGVRAVLVNYACHCTTLKGGDNYVHPDWAGEAAKRIEGTNGGAVALVAIGCGADSDPQPRGLPAVATNGGAVAEEVARVMAGEMRAVGQVTHAAFRRIELPLGRTVPREELEARLKGKPNIAYAAAQFCDNSTPGNRYRRRCRIRCRRGCLAGISRWCFSAAKWWRSMRCA